MTITKTRGPRKTADMGLLFLEEAVLQVLREVHPEAMPASEIRNALGIWDPQTGFGKQLIDTLIRRLERQGLIEQIRPRGPWRLVVS